MSRILLIILLIVGLMIGLYLLNQQTHLFSKAGGSDVPKQVQISNISDNSFTVSWTTLLSVPGFVTFGKDESLGQAALDDRDKSSKNTHFTHHVTLKNLTPNTTYYFKIGSGANVYDKQGKPFTQTTAPTTSDTPPLAEPLFGKVIKGDSKPPAEALVYLQAEKNTLLSGYTQANGNFLITLNNGRTADLSKYLTIADTTDINVLVDAGPDGRVQRAMVGKARSTALTLTLQPVPGSSASPVAVYSVWGHLKDANETPVAGITVEVYNDKGVKKTAVTDKMGIYVVEGFINKDDGYAVRIPTQAGVGSVKTSSLGWSWMFFNGLDVAVGSPTYEFQQAGHNDCAGPNNTGQKGRCNFTVTASQAAATAQPSSAPLSAAAAPVNLTQVCSNTAVANLSWNQASVASSYIVRLNKEPYTDWMGPGDDYQVASGTSLSLPIIPGDNYQWRVSAVGVSGPAADSQQVTFSCPASNTAVLIGRCYKNTIKLAWNAITGTSKYVIRVDDLANGWGGYNIQPGDFLDDNVTTTSYTSDKGQTGHKYTAWMQTLNSSGNFFGDVSNKSAFTCQ